MIEVHFIAYDAEKKIGADRRPDLMVMPTAERVQAAWDAGAYVLTARVDTDNLEAAWRKTNNVDSSWSLDPNPGVTVIADLPHRAGRSYGHRSAMVGDVFVRDGEAFYVAAFGFEPVDLSRKH